MKKSMNRRAAEFAPRGALSVRLNGNPGPIAAIESLSR
jgi:hypothetical protein